MTRSTEISEENEKEHKPDELDPEPSSSDFSLNKKKRDKNKKHRRATIMIRLMTVIIDASDIKEEPPEKLSDQIMRTFNRKVAEDNV